MVYLVLTSARQGRRAGFATVAGVTLGLATYLAATVAGLAEVALRAPCLFHALRVAGVGYMLWLALDVWRDAGPAAGPDADAGPWRLAARGFAVNILNPKALAFYLLLLPGFVDSERPAVPQLAALGGLHLVVSVFVHSALVLAGGAAHRVLTQPAFARSFRAASALGLATIAVWLAWTTRAAA